MIRILDQPAGAVPVATEGLAAASAAVEQWRSGGDRIWLDVEAPENAETDMLRDALGFDELSLEDATRADHPPKVEEVGALGDRGAYLLVIVRAPVEGDPTRAQNVALFLRGRLLVTIHATPSPAIESARTCVLRDPALTMGRGIEFVAHAVLDQLVSSYDPLLDDFERRIDTLEEEILDDQPQGDFEKILALRRAVAGTLRDTRPMRDVTLSLAREGHPLIKPTSRLAFRDLYDHLLRIHDLLESHRDTITSIRDAYLALVNNRMNEVMKTLTVVAVMSGALSVVTGVFGMNFEGMPGAHSPGAFWISVGGMLVLALVIVGLFRWKRWV